MAKSKKKNIELSDFSDEPPKGSIVRDFVGFVKEERFKIVVGAITLSFAVFLAISFVSFIFTWKADQSKLDISAFAFLKSADIVVENWMGKSGAIMANLFIHKWFGLASFSVVLILIVCGLRLFNIRFLHLRKTIFYSLLLTIWTSIALAFFFGTKFFYLGGIHGFFISKWLNAFWGETGTLLFLSVVIFTFIVFAIKNSVNFFKAVFARREKEVVEDTLMEPYIGKNIVSENNQETDFYNQTISEVRIETANEEIEETHSDSETKNLIPVDEIQESSDKIDDPADEVLEEIQEPIFEIQETAIDSNNKPTDELLNIEIKKKHPIDKEIPLTIEPKFIEEVYVENKENNLITETIAENSNVVQDEVLLDIEPEKQEELPVKFAEKKVDKALEFTLTQVKTGEKISTEKADDSLNDDVQFTVEKNEDEPTDEYLENGELRIPSVLAPYDSTLDLSHFKMPPIDLLVDHKSVSEVTQIELTSNKNKIVETLKNYGIEIASIKATIGPTITLYEIVPAPGVRISKIRNLEDDIALSLSALGIRIIAPMPGKGTIGIEVPNLKPEIVSMRSIISSTKFQESKFDLPVALGRTISNDTFVFDLAKMPHLLVAGATGQGKSVGLNAILTSLLYKKHPSQLKFVLVDPKKVELTLYSKIESHYLAKLPGEEEAIIFDNMKVVNTLKSLCIEMDNRYNLLRLAKVRNLKEYNDKFTMRRLNPEKGHCFLPYIVIIIDEFADLIMTAGKEVEMPIARIAQLARAVGIHMIIATQRPSTNVITGSIKANFPARIAFKVASMIDSRTIIDCPGANQLIGKGDMLFSQGGDLVRIQCAFVDTPEVEMICDFIGNQQGYPNAFLLPEYVPEGSEMGSEIIETGKRDDLFDEAARLIVVHQQGSTSLIQRHMSIGYNRAGRIVDQLEKYGIVGPFEGSKARKVLFSDIMSLDAFLQNLK